MTNSPRSQPRSFGLPSLRRDRPVPLWVLLPLFFVGVYLSHATLLRLPYYWDEAGYYIPAAWDFFRTGSLIPSTTLSNAHPPLPSIYLALWWKLGNMVPSVTRTAMVLVTATGLLGVYRIAIILTRLPQVAALTVLLTALYPVWFAQSTLAHGDVFAAAANLWALSYVFEDTRRSYTLASLLFSVAALSKETAIVVPGCLILYELGAAWKERKVAQLSRGPEAPSRWRRILLLASPALPLTAWFAFHRYKTGYIFGNPAYLRYNATETLTPLRIAVALGHRVLHVTAYMNIFVPLLCMAAAMVLPPRPESARTLRMKIPVAAQVQILVIVLGNLLAFSVLGGALLTRYLLPLYPLIFLICVNTWRRRVPFWPALAALSAGAFLAALWVNPPYRFAPEDNLAYANVIRLHQQAVGRIVRQYPKSTVLTAWPATDELSKPELGYVARPIPVIKVENFSSKEIQAAARLPDAFDLVFAFSTKYDPASPLFGVAGSANEKLDERFFAYHHDLRPEVVAQLLAGQVIWEAERKGQWAALIHLERPQFADLIW